MRSLQRATRRGVDAAQGHGKRTDAEVEERHSHCADVSRLPSPHSQTVNPLARRQFVIVDSSKGVHLSPICQCPEDIPVTAGPANLTRSIVSLLLILHGEIAIQSTLIVANLQMLPPRQRR
jgi:hypothetical protein